LSGITGSGNQLVVSVVAFEKIVGKRSSPIDTDELHGLVFTHDAVELDIGTGDGRHVLETAREEPSRLVIGIDAVAENMTEISRKAAATPRKGGVGNAIYIRGAAEQLPGPFAGLADLVTVNYPWGSLMRIVAEPDIEALAGIHALCKPLAKLRILLNYTVIADRPYLERLGLGAMLDPADNPNLVSDYNTAGFTLECRQVFAGDPPVRTRWGRQLVRGAARQTLLVEATAHSNGATR
jgi:16S rRNA (adenine(1408)-N(1))-methyltransferase